jgi:hypothetical protein
VARLNVLTARRAETASKRKRLLMNVLMVRSNVKAESVAEVEAAI